MGATRAKAKQETQPSSPARADRDSVSLAPPVYGIELADRSLELSAAGTRSTAMLEDEADRFADRLMAGARNTYRPQGDPIRRMGMPSGLAGLLGRSEPLSPQLRSRWEAITGFDLGAIQLHRHETASATVHQHEANALAAGSHIALARADAPSTSAGQRLIAHEVAHVIQQSLGSPTVQFDNGHRRRSRQHPTFDPVGERLTEAAFERRYPRVLEQLRDLDVAIDQVRFTIVTRTPRTPAFSQLVARYRHNQRQWGEAMNALDPHFSIALVMLAVRLAEPLLVTANRINDAMMLYSRQGRTGLGYSMRETSPLSIPLPHAWTIFRNLRTALGRRREAQRVHQIVGEQVAADRRGARERAARAWTARSVEQVEASLRQYVHNVQLHESNVANSPAQFALGVARLLHGEFRNESRRYIQLFRRLERNDLEFYRFILFRGTMISHLTDMGVPGLVGHVYREADRAGAHALLGAWDFDPVTGEERNAPAWLLGLDVLVGLIPIIGTVPDVRDVCGYVYRIGRYPGQRTNGWTWVGLVGSLIGFIPAAGDTGKSILAAIRRAATDLPVGRLSDAIVGRIARRLPEGAMARIADGADYLAHSLTEGWAVIRREAQALWQRIISELGPALTRVSDLTRAELDLVRRAAREYLPEALQRAGDWLGQLVRSLIVRLRLGVAMAAGGLAERADELMAVIVEYRNRWRLTARAFHELWSPTARFVAQLSPHERVAVRAILLQRAADEGVEVVTGIRRLFDEASDVEAAAARSAPDAARSASDASQRQVASVDSPRPGQIHGPASGTARRLASHARRGFGNMRDTLQRWFGTRIPDGAAWIHRDLHDAEVMYRQWVRRSRGREVGIWQNAATHEYVVMQGSGDWIHGTVELPNLTDRWIPIAHYHPEMNALAQYASQADFGALIRAWGGTRSIRRRMTSRIDLRDPLTGREFYSVFGYDPHAHAPFFVDVEVPGGGRVEYSFEHLPDLERHFRGVSPASDVVHAAPMPAMPPGAHPTPLATSTGTPRLRTAREEEPLTTMLEQPAPRTHAELGEEAARDELARLRREQPHIRDLIADEALQRQVAAQERRIAERATQESARESVSQRSLLEWLLEDNTRLEEFLARAPQTQPPTGTTGTAIVVRSQFLRVRLVELATGLTPSQVDMAGRLLGHSFSDHELAIFARLWTEARSPRRLDRIRRAVEARGGSVRPQDVARRVFDGCRRAFWRAVRRDATARELLESAGIRFRATSRSGSAPVWHLRNPTTGEWQYWTIDVDHMLELGEQPLTSLLANNLRFSPQRENRVLLNQIHRLTEFVHRVRARYPASWQSEFDAMLERLDTIGSIDALTHVQPAVPPQVRVAIEEDELEFVEVEVPSGRSTRGGSERL